MKSAVRINDYRKILSAFIDLSVFIIFYVFLNWNFFAAFLLSEIIGWSVRLVLSLIETNAEFGTRVIAFINNGRWLFTFLAIVPTTIFLITAPRYLTPLDYIVGEFFIALALVFTGVITWRDGKKTHAILFFIACLGWLLLSIDMIMFSGYENNAIERIRDRESSTTALLLATVGIEAVAYTWSLLITLRSRRAQQVIDDLE